MTQPASPPAFEGHRAAAAWHDGDPAPPRGAVAAIGNFDGVHRGHRHLLDATLAQARRLGRPAAILTFEPRPRGCFRAGAGSFRLTP